MQTKPKQQKLANGIIDCFPSATSHLLSLSAGSCKIRVIWKDDGGNTRGVEETLKVDDPIRINERIDAIEITAAQGNGTLHIEGYNA